MAKITCYMVCFVGPKFILALLILQCSHYTCRSFQHSPFLTTNRSTVISQSVLIPKLSQSLPSNKSRYHSHAHFYADPTSSNVHDQTTPPPSFEERMREQLKRHQLNQRKIRPKFSFVTKEGSGSTQNTGPNDKLVTDVRNLQEYKEVLDQTGEDDQMLAVLWYSPWCKACRAVMPGIRTLAKRHPNVKFIQVPVLAENANLHQGLDVPSVPYLHLYVPDDPRLVEEKKMTRKRLSGFQKLLCDYERGHCSLEQGLPEGDSNKSGEKKWSTLNPYLSSRSSVSTGPRNNSVAETRGAGVGATER